MTEPEDLLQTAYNNLKLAIETYNESYRVMRRGLDGAYSRVSGSMGIDGATRNYEKREKEFNQQVSNRMRDSGNVPSLAEEMLLHQRNNGFHARGLAKILSAQGRKTELEDKKNPWPLAVTARIGDESRERYDSDEGAEALLRVKFDMLYHVTLSKLREAGRVQDARSLKLYCYNYDLKTQQEKE